MYLLYLDDSGLIDDPASNFCVIAGCSVFETKTHWIEQDMNEIAQRYFPNFEIEFHGSPMRTGNGVWRGMPREARMAAVRDVFEMVSARGTAVRFFASVVDKRCAAGQDISELLFTQVSSRFDMFLGRLYKKTNKAERGIVIFDKSKSEYQIQKMCRNYKSVGHAWGSLKNFSEVPLFLDSKNSRLIQLADLIAYYVFRYFEHQDDTFYPFIKKSYDREGSIIHGLHVLNKDKYNSPF